MNFIAKTSVADLTDAEFLKALEFIITSPSYKSDLDFLNDNNVTLGQSHATSIKGDSKGRLIWKFFKVLLFITCNTCFFYQTAIFCLDYYTYPTTTNVIVTTSTIFKNPAVTVCNPNPVPRSRFCSENPNLCQKPYRINEFCRKHPHFCKWNVSQLLIPKLGYYAEDLSLDVRKATHRFLYNEDMKFSSFYSFFSSGTETKVTTVFARDFQKATDVKCYSINLHLSSRTEQDRMVIDLINNNDKRAKGKFLYSFGLNLKEDETFFPWALSQARILVHSPYVPVDPIDEGQAIHSGHTYMLLVNLEEEHLLPAPYQTDCMDYDALWRKNNKTGPRSQEMCKELCEMSFSQECYGCETGLRMYRNPNKWCAYKSDLYCDYHYVLVKDLHRCKENCKSECVKLKYEYTFKEMFREPLWVSISFNAFLCFLDITYVHVQVKDLQVMVIKHSPLYSSGDLFSFIGGLMGCWLGVSIWAFPQIVESALEKAVQLMQMLKRKVRRPTSVEDDVLSQKY